MPLASHCTTSSHTSSSLKPWVGRMSMPKRCLWHHGILFATDERLWKEYEQGTSIPHIYEEWCQHLKPYTREKDLLYPVVCWIDDRWIQRLPIKEKHQWEHHLLEEHFFGTHSAGETFFARAEHLLKHEGSRLVLWHYAFALSQGFRGPYTTQDTTCRYLLERMIDRLRTNDQLPTNITVIQKKMPSWKTLFMIILIVYVFFANILWIVYGRHWKNLMQYVQYYEKAQNPPSPDLCKTPWQTSRV